jgi:hypothetical protein
MSVRTGFTLCWKAPGISSRSAGYQRAQWFSKGIFHDASTESGVTRGAIINDFVISELLTFSSFCAIR